MPGPIRRAHLRSLAKINLDLRVLHRRPDGFHEMRSVFNTISLSDSIDVTYESARRTEISLHDPAEIPDNLILRAARATLDALRVSARVHFRLRKRIPMGGGFGGGSSNAAAVLQALPALAERALPPETSMEIAAGLGSDVPFFLLGGTAVATGRGAELYPLPDLAPEPLLLIVSGVHVATADAYRALNRGCAFEEASNSAGNFYRYVWTLEQSRSAAAASVFSANDFEATVFERHSELGAIVTRLRKIAPKVNIAGVRMTGSGSGIFALFHSTEDRKRAAEALRANPAFRGCRVVPAALIGRSKYRQMWRKQLGVAGNDPWPLS